MRREQAHRRAPAARRRARQRAEASAAQTAPTSTPTPAPNCDPNYQGACLDPNAVDYDCAGGSGNGPKYTGEVRVVGVDHYELDRNGDGIGCEPD
jgi:hypothetical protein